MNKDNADKILALEKVKKQKMISPFKVAIKFSLVFGIFITLISAFNQIVYRNISDQTRVIRGGRPFGYLEWTETRCPDYIFKTCERSDRKFIFLNFLLNLLILSGLSFVISYTLIAWNIKGPPWRYYYDPE